MDSKIPLEYLLKFKGAQAFDLARKLKEGDSSLKQSIDGLLREALDSYDEQYEREGPQALAHLGFLLVEVGNYRKKVSDSHSIFDYLEAWRVFMDSENRGHDVDADQLVKDEPQLLTLGEVWAHYHKNPQVKNIASYDSSEYNSNALEVGKMLGKSK